jgi:predicted polyphosphate/ATP-dependent NAD kinase
MLGGHCGEGEGAMRIGLVVNPVAGLGGTVGLKGTDGPGTVAEALRRGAVPQAGPRARRALERLASRVPGAAILAAPGPMGAGWLDGLALAVTPAGEGPSSGTARDTRDACAELLAAGAGLIVFAGGDGTARDVAAAAGGAAILGIPCGVKMHSGVFALSPEAAGAVMADLLTDPTRVAWDGEAEIMDIDEAALRAGRLAPRLFGLARAPVSRLRMQAAKGGPRRDAGAALQAAAAEVAREMEPGTLYVVGPGSSAGAVTRAAGHEPTLLGIDALRDGRRVARDATAAAIEALAGDGPVRIVLGVTGRQGFILGRGNQQIGPALVSRAGREGLIVMATEEKLTALAEPRLWVDTGDPALDRRLAGFIRVRTGVGRSMVMRVGAAE